MIDMMKMVRIVKNDNIVKMVMIVLRLCKDCVKIVKMTVTW